MPRDPISFVQTEIPQLPAQFQYPGSNWAEFDIFSLLKPLETLHKIWNSAPMQLLRYAYERYRKVSRWLNPRHNSPFEDLPTEVLVEIFKYMGWRDVLASRQVCMRLFEISTARPLWTHLFHRLSTELMAPLILERPMDTYKSRELEQIVLRRISSEIRWTSELPPRTRGVPITMHREKDSALLLEGGRWLLVMSPRRGYGRVYAYDLDSSLCQEPQCIIDLGEGSGDPQQIWYMAADMDTNRSQLTFNLCLIPSSTFEQESASNIDLPPAGIHLYRIILNGCGREATLVVDKIKTLRNRFRAVTHRIALRGRYLARSLYVSGPFSLSIEVCDWVLSDESTHLKLHIPLANGILNNIDLLPDGKLVAVLNDGISLYHVANLHSVPSGKLGDKSDIPPYWKHSDPKLYSLTHLSKPYIHGDTTRVVVALKGTIYGLVIPRHSNNDPWYEQLSNVKMSRTLWASFGIDKAYVQKRSGRVEIASYIWPGDECKTNDSPSLLIPAAHYRIWQSPHEWCTFPLFDERTNRLFSIVEGGSCVVIDFAFTCSRCDY